MRPFFPGILFVFALLLPASLTSHAAEDKVAGETKEEGSAAEDDGPQIPDDLLDDEHVKEESGVNEFTAPSIKKLFNDLDSLGTLPYDSLKRALPTEVSTDRSLVSLALGLLIGDGFLSVQSEKIGEMEDVGRQILRHAKVLGAGARIKEHTQSILENSTLGDWKSLKEDLAKTQRDVEGEMVLLRDVDMAHLISMGGWLRGLQIASTAALDPFSAQRAQVLARNDIAAYFGHILDELNIRIRELPHMEKLRGGILEIEQMTNLPDGRPFTKDEVTKLKEKADALVELLATASQKRG